MLLHVVKALFTFLHLSFQKSIVTIGNLKIKKVKEIFQNNFACCSGLNHVLLGNSYVKTISGVFICGWKLPGRDHIMGLEPS